MLVLRTTNTERCACSVFSVATREWGSPCGLFFHFEVSFLWEVQGFLVWNKLPRAEWCLFFFKRTQSFPCQQGIFFANLLRKMYSCSLATAMLRVAFFGGVCVPLHRESLCRFLP